MDENARRLTVWLNRAFQAGSSSERGVEIGVMAHRFVSKNVGGTDLAVTTPSRTASAEAIFNRVGTVRNPFLMPGSSARGCFRPQRRTLLVGKK
jgi:hypothetical protein